MVDERVRKIAEILIDYSTEVRKGDRVLIEADVDARPLIVELYKQALLRGAYPRVKLRLPELSYIFFKHASEEQLKYFPEVDYYEVQRTDVFIGIRAPRNTRELSTIDPSRIGLRMKVLKPILDWRVEKTRWCVFYYPTSALAQEANMPYEEFEEFVFNSCLIDWRELSKRMEKIKKAIEATDEVRIIGERTDLRFSVKGRKAIVADGKHNMPDGEIFTCLLYTSPSPRD